MKQVTAKILSKEKLHHNCFKLLLESKYLKEHACPGQFVSVRCSDSTSPLLKRPFGIHKITSAGIELLIKIVGPATRALSQKEKGQEVTVIGPLGKGFSVEEKKTHILLVAGGYGVVPLFFLAEKIKKENKKAKISVFLGGQTAEDIFCAEDFKKLKAKVFFSTNDGTKGHKGFVTAILMKELVKMDPEKCMIYACGPKPLLRAIADLSKEEKIEAEVSMEEYLACGIGVCMGCAIDTIEGKKLICKDGPVFNAQEIIWQKQGSLEQEEDKRMNL